MTENLKILVVAPEVPARDRSSGELRLYTILKILSARYHIVFVALNPRGDQRDGQYRPDLEALGLEVYIRNYSFRKILSTHKFSAAFIEFYFTAEHCLSNIRILQPRCPIIVDSVDIHYHREWLKYKVTGVQKDLEKSIETKKRELIVYKRADVVIAVTREDADVVLREDPAIRFEIVPNIHPIVEDPKQSKSKNDLIFIGSFKHDPNTDAVKYFCQDVLPLVHKKHPAVKVRIAGANPPDELKRLAGPYVEFLGFVPSVTPCLQESYISIAPLRFGAGMKGKIGEAMAHGLPVVTTSIGIQGLDLKHGENIMIGDTPGEFADSILELITDEHLHARISGNGMNYIKANFTPETIRGEILRIFENIESRPVKKNSASEKLRFLTQYITQKYLKKEPA